MNTKLDTQPIKGFRDFIPADWKIQRYIFDTWRNVCESYGYQEYNGPVLEYAAIYEKSGDDLGTTGKELYRFEDKGGRVVALRPEMTPTVGRMIAAYEKSFAKPIRWFSIAQFFRAEKPQKGRGREFFQLNVDIFGDDSVYSDIEILNLAIDLMKAFGATSDMFELRFNNRYFSYFYFENVLGLKDESKKSKLLKIIDRFPKKGKVWLQEEIVNSGLGIDFNELEKYLSLGLTDVIKVLEDLVDDNSYDNYEEIKRFYDTLLIIQKANLSEYCKYDATIVRGLDYYTGTVFEVFDKNPQNARAILGGGRYDDLVSMYKDYSIPAVGFGLGDMPLRIFLEGWNLLNLPNDKETYYFPIIDENIFANMLNIIGTFRSKGKTVIMGTKPQGLSKALSEANKKGYDYVIIFGKEEFDKGVIKIKDMKLGKEEIIKIGEV